MYFAVFLSPFSVWGLFVGCLLANIISVYGIADIVFGSLATLIAALCTMYIGKKGKEGIGSKALACLPPVLANGVIIGAVIAFMTTPGSAFWAGFAVNGLQVAIGELAVMFVLGFPLLVYLPNTKFFRELLYKYNQK